MKSCQRLLIYLLLIILPLASVASCTRGSYLPGFEGTVLDKESGKPLEDAYVVCFTDYYSCGQQINPGGGSAHPDELQVAITDKNGYFKIHPYRKYSGGWADARRVYIFKEGYIYALLYAQYSDKKNVLCRGCDILNPCCEETSLGGSIKFYLSNKENKNNYGSALSNGFDGLLHGTYYYHAYFRDSNKAAYKKFKPYFLYLYKIVDRYSNEIQKTFPEPHMAQNWNFDLSRFRADLRDDLNRNGGR